MATFPASPTFAGAPAFPGSAAYPGVAGYSGAAVSVDDNATPLATVPTYPWGQNARAIDAHLDAALATALAGTGTRILRYPGGTHADRYHPGTVSGGTLANRTQFWTPGYTSTGTLNTNFDAFMTNVVATLPGCGVMITANYGSNAAGTGGGDPAEAAAWATYAKATYPGKVAMWEIGNEQYSATPQSLDLHATHDAPTYGANAATFITAIKAADASAKVGVVAYPDAPGGGGAFPTWNSGVFTALVQAGVIPDAVIIHWYPQGSGSETDAGLFYSTTLIPSYIAQLRSEMVSAFGSGLAAGIAIWVTEQNSVINPGGIAGQQTVARTNALWAADSVLTMLEAGVQTVVWWAAHSALTTSGGARYNVPGNINGAVIDPSPYGDYAILALGETSGSVVGPALNTRYPSWYGFGMLAGLCAPGDLLLPATCSNPMLGVHAVKRQVAGSGDTKVGVLLVNRLPVAQTVTVTLSNYTPAGAATVSSYGYGLTSPASSTPTLGATFSYTVPAYQMASLLQ